MRCCLGNGRFVIWKKNSSIQQYGHNNFGRMERSDGIHNIEYSDDISLCNKGSSICSLT